MRKFDSADLFKAAAEQLLIDGNNTLSVIKLYTLIPVSTKNSWKSDWSNISWGFKYHFYLADGKSVTVKWHSEDPDAACEFSGCNSGKMWTAQIRVGNRLLEYGDNPKWVRCASNETHIPLR